MLIAIHGVIKLNTTHGMKHELKLYAHCYTCSEALSSFLYMV